jgi:hypothetical protein
MDLQEHVAYVGTVRYIEKFEKMPAHDHEHDHDHDHEHEHADEEKKETTEEKKE